MTEATKQGKKAVVFTKMLQIVAKRRLPDKDGKRVDETVYVQLDGMNNLLSLRHSLVARDDAQVGDLWEIPAHPIGDQLFLYVAEQQLLARVVTLPDDPVALPEAQKTEDVKDPSAAVNGNA